MKVSQVLRIIAFHAGQHSARAVSYLMSYEPYEALIAPARAKASLLRLILGLVITALLYMLLVRLSWQVLLSVMGEAWFEQTLQLPGLLAEHMKPPSLKAETLTLHGLMKLLVIVPLYYMQWTITLFGLTARPLK